MKRMFVSVAVLLGLAFAATMVNSTAKAEEFDSRIQQGLVIAPVKLKLHGLNPVLVGLGSYIVNAQGGCNDCHTNPPYAENHDPFTGARERINKAGYLAGGVAFGPFTSRNITPRGADRLPAGLTLREFKETLRRGTDLKNRHPEISPLLQVMPWPVYGNMTDRDLESVYEYLRAIPCVGSADRCGN